MNMIGKHLFIPLVNCSQIGILKNKIIDEVTEITSFQTSERNIFISHSESFLYFRNESTLILNNIHIHTHKYTHTIKIFFHIVLSNILLFLH